MYLNKSLVRFRNNKPYLFKKIVVTICSLTAFAYFISNVNLITGIILFLFVGIPLISKIKKQPSEGKGFFGKIKNFYKNLYKDYVIDEVPLDIECKETEINIILHKAEIIKRKTVKEFFSIGKDDVAGILFDDVDNELLIMFQKAVIKVTDENDNLIREITQYNSTICFKIDDNQIRHELLEMLKINKYPLEYLSEIEDEEEETEDPELKNIDNNISVDEEILENEENTME